MNIRRATQEDLQYVAAVHRASILGLCAQHYSVVQLSQWTDALRPEGYAALLASREFLVAEQDGELLGFGVLDLSESLVNATYVSPKAVRRGVGRRLLEAMETIARQQGASRLQLSSTLNAVPFYQSLGYLQQGAGTNRLPTGVELPCILMTKDLVGERRAAQQSHSSECEPGGSVASSRAPGRRQGDRARSFFRPFAPKCIAFLLLLTTATASAVSIHEAAKELGVSVSTVERLWAYARAWLFRALRQGLPTLA